MSREGANRRSKCTDEGVDTYYGEIGQDGPTRWGRQRALTLTEHSAGRVRLLVAAVPASI